MLKKKIGFFITSEEYLRNFVNSNIINQISKNFEVHIFLNEKIKIDKRKVKNCKSISKFSSSSNEKSHQYWNLIKIWKYRDKAKSFEARVLEHFRIDSKRFKKNKNNDFYFNFRNLISVISFSKDLIKFLVLNFLSYGFFFRIFKSFYIKKLLINQSLLNCINKKKIDLIINPTSAHNSETIDLIKIGKIKKIQSLLIIDNWDNLSSKIFFDEKPDHIFCWGEQSVIHGKKIHGFKKNIKSIGSARFDLYFKKRKLKQKTKLKEKHVLFLGSSLKWNEKEALHILDNFISTNQKTYKNIKIIYRPHPKLNWREWFFNENYSHVKIDYQISNTKHREWPDLNYYPRLLSECLFVVGGLTSMIIEATIFYKKYLAISYDDKNYLWNQKYVLKTRPHLKEINTLNNIYLCNQKKNLPKIFDKIFKESLNLSKKNKIEIDKKRNFFLYSDRLSFSERIGRHIKGIFSNEKNN